jgi:lambda family phage tail tape measure protein
MGFGNLSIKVGADIGGFTSSMDIAKLSAKSSMGASAGSVDDFRDSLLRASADMKKAAQAMSSNMQAANDSIVSNSDKSAEAIQNISDTANTADFKSMGEKISEAIGAGVGAGLFVAQKGWEGFTAYAQTKALVVGLAVSAIFAAVGLGAIYTAYKVISGSLGFITGLITGSSYQSASIDALVTANNQVKEIQNSLHLTAQQAAATNAAIAAIGINKADYMSVFTGAETAIRANTKELDRLGVAYKDAKGNLLPLDQVVQNANKTLNDYTEGWDRNSAAAAIGMGSAAAVAAAASVTSAKIAEAGARLNDYNLGIGDESQAAVKRYEKAMLEFNRETDLTAQGFKRAWADSIMPALTDFAEFFKDGFPAAVNAFRYAIASIASLFYGLKTVVYAVAESILGSVSSIGSILGGIGLAATKVLSGDFTGAKDALVSGWTDAKNRLGAIGDNISAQALHNADAMRLAWATDDRNAPGVAVAKKGKTFVPKPEQDAKDDVAKRIMEGALKVEEDFIASENTLLQSREEMLKRYHDKGLINDADYYATERDLIAANLKTALGAYDDQVGALEEFIKTRAKEEEKLHANNKIDEIWRKQAVAEAAASKKLIGLSLDEADAAAKKDPWAGAAESIRKYGQAANDVGTQIESSLTGAFKGAEDAMVQFTMTGKASFGDLARSIIADLLRIQFRQSLAGLSSGATSFLGSLMSGGSSSANAGASGYGASLDALNGTGSNIVGLAEGGSPPLNVASMVGEQGPELFVPKGAGTIIPNDQLRGGGAGGFSPTINISIDSRTDRAEVEALTRRAVNQSISDYDERRRRQEGR